MQSRRNFIRSGSLGMLTSLMLPAGTISMAHQGRPDALSNQASGSAACTKNDHDRTQWFANCGWGLFAHYAAHNREQGSYTNDKFSMTPSRWNKMINAFDAEGLADQLSSIGVPYLFITIGHASDFFISPNATYDKITGQKPSRCSERDLIADLSSALNKKGIRLMTYMTSTPAQLYTEESKKRLQWTERKWKHGNCFGERQKEFQRNWEAILSEWSLRWKDAISGWWIDTVYNPNDMYRFEEEPNFKSFASALRAGNQDSILSFAPGAKKGIMVPLTEEEDYLAGENHQFLMVNKGRWVKGWGFKQQFHCLTYLGDTWGAGLPQYSDELVAAYAEHIVSHEGVASFDVPMTDRGLFDQKFDPQLRKIAAKCNAITKNRNVKK